MMSCPYPKLVLRISIPVLALFLSACPSHYPVAIHFPDDPRIFNGMYQGLIDTRSNSTQLALSGDGTSVFTAGGNTISAVQLWDAQTAKLLRTFGALDATAYSVEAFSVNVDGSRLAAAITGENSGTQVWDTASGELLQTFEEAIMLDLSADGTLLALGSGFGYGGDMPKIVIREVATGSMRRELPLPGDYLAAMQLSDDGQVIVTLSANYTNQSPNKPVYFIKAWAVQTGEQRYSYEGTLPENVSQVSTLPLSLNDSSFIVPIGSELVTVSLDSGTVERRIKSPLLVGSASLSPDGRTLAVSTDIDSERTRITFLDAATGEVQKQLENAFDVWWSLDNRYLLTSKPPMPKTPSYYDQGGRVATLVALPTFAEVARYQTGELLKVTIDATATYFDAERYRVSGTMILNSDERIPFRGEVIGNGSQRYLKPQVAIPPPPMLTLELESPDNTWTLHAEQMAPYGVDDLTSWYGYIDGMKEAQAFITQPELIFQRESASP